jgi:hypothetical protein
MSVETLSEGWFDRYLGEHGYKWATHPDYGIGKFPDREIRRGGLTAVCEIKQFDTDPASHLGTGGGYVDRYGLIRGAIKAAADQLRPLEDSAMPLVVVLANPQGRLAVETIETLSASAVRLPHGLFNAPQDRRWAPDYERGRIVLL